MTALSTSQAARLARKQRSRDKPLTPRQVEVLLCIANGLTGAEAGAHMGIGKKTVEQHIHNICARLGVLCRVQAVLKAERLGLLKEVVV